MRSAKKIKIGFVFDDTLDSFDGVAQNVKLFGSWLTKQGHEVCYLVGETELKEWAGGKVYSLSKNQKVTFNGNQARIPLISKKNNIKKVLEKEHFDVLHVQAPYSPFMAQRVMRLANKKTIIIATFHVAPMGMLPRIGGRLLRLIYGKSLKRFDQIYSVSTEAAEYAKSAFGVESEILPNVIDVERFNKAHKSTKLNKNTVVFLGRLVKRKGCRELIDAFTLLYQQNSKVKLLIGGKGPEVEELKNLVIKNDLNDVVNFLGFIEEKDKPALLASAHIACFPSISGESFGVSLLEAMAAGKGVVLAGDNPGYRTILKGRSAMLVNPKNKLAFAGRLSELLENKS